MVFNTEAHPIRRTWKIVLCRQNDENDRKQMSRKPEALAKASEKKILITGGTGFLGTHIVRQLLDAGEKNLRVMASRVPEWMKDAGVEAAEGSVTDRDDVAEACKNVSAIFHLAGKVSRDNDDAAAMNKIHLEGTRLLCEAAKEAGVKTMVLASSSGTIAVSEDEQIFDETYPQPVEIISRWAYYASKYYQERTALENFDGDGRRLVIMNPSLLLGPGDERLSARQNRCSIFSAARYRYTPERRIEFCRRPRCGRCLYRCAGKGKASGKISARRGEYDVSREFFGTAGTAFGRRGTDAESAEEARDGRLEHYQVPFSKIGAKPRRSSRRRSSRPSILVFRFVKGRGRAWFRSSRPAGNAFSNDRVSKGEFSRRGCLLVVHQ